MIYKRNKDEIERIHNDIFKGFKNCQESWVNKKKFPSNICQIDGCGNIATETRMFFDKSWLKGYEIHCCRYCAEQIDKDQIEFFHIDYHAVDQFDIRYKPSAQNNYYGHYSDEYIEVSTLPGFASQYPPVIINTNENPTAVSPKGTSYEVQVEINKKAFQTAAEEIKKLEQAFKLSSKNFAKRIADAIPPWERKPRRKPKRKMVFDRIYSHMRSENCPILLLCKDNDVFQILDEAIRQGIIYEYYPTHRFYSYESLKLHAVPNSLILGEASYLYDLSKKKEITLKDWENIARSYHSNFVLVERF